MPGVRADPAPGGACGSGDHGMPGIGFSGGPSGRVSLAGIGCRRAPAAFDGPARISRGFLRSARELNLKPDFIWFCADIVA
ncbi:MAG: hypothetical protein JRE18_07455 [Deltaproteobacteria bacterium]|nr:hypothetical protein [Deltaproteobacteria bacterium]